MSAASSGESCSSVSTWKIIAGSPVGSLPFGFSGSFPTRRIGGFARCSDSSDTSLTEAFRLQQEERKENHRAYMKVLRAHGFPMTEEEVRAVAPFGGIGRAHYARVMVNKGYVTSVQEAFDRYLGVGGPCYVKRNVMRPEEAIALIHRACSAPAQAGAARRPPRPPSDQAFG